MTAFYAEKPYSWWQKLPSVAYNFWFRLFSLDAQPNMYQFNINLEIYVRFANTYFVKSGDSLKERGSCQFAVSSFVGQAWRSLLDPCGSTSPSGMVDLHDYNVEHMICQDTIHPTMDKKDTPCDPAVGGRTGRGNSCLPEAYPCPPAGVAPLAEIAPTKSERIPNFISKFTNLAGFNPKN